MGENALYSPPKIRQCSLITYPKDKCKKSTPRLDKSAKKICNCVERLFLLELMRVDGIPLLRYIFSRKSF